MNTYIFRAHYGSYPSQNLYSAQAQNVEAALAAARVAIPLRTTGDRIEVRWPGIGNGASR